MSDRQSDSQVGTEMKQKKQQQQQKTKREAKLFYKDKLLFIIIATINNIQTHVFTYVEVHIHVCMYMCLAQW